MDDSTDASPTLPARFGRYHVVAAIPGGAMGRLYLAQDPEIDRLVVVKALDSGSSTEQKQRFLREARAAGRLSHPNVVSIFDVGEQDRTPFIVMEYIEGETLSAIIKNREPILFSRRLEIIDQLCAGLAYAHDQGVVHRDIKPSNLMLDKAGKLRILDFGIARLDTSDQTQTSTGIVGTLNYMSPEQWEGGVIEGRSDMFSVGAVMYELFSFTKAFPGSTPPEVLRYMFGEGPRPLQDVCPLAPPALADVVARMLARTPADRFANLHQVRDALAGLRADVRDMPEEFGDKTIPMGAARLPGPIAGGPTRATGARGWPVPRPGATSTPGPATGNVMSGPIPSAAERRGRTIRLVTLGAAGVVVIGLAAWLVLKGLTGTPGPVVNPAAGTSTSPAANAVPPPAPANPPDVAATTPATTPDKGTAAGKAPAAGGRSAAQPPPTPTGPVDLTVSWSLPFEVVQGGKKLSNGPSARQVLKDVHPDRGEVYADSQALRLHFRVPTEKSGSIRIREPGRLAVTLTPQYLACWVVVDGSDFRLGSILPGRPAPIAEGKHRVTLRCPNGLKADEQVAEVKSGLEPTEINFPPGGGG